MSSEWVLEWVRIGAEELRGSKYRMEASSPWRSVPAATVRPSVDTSNERNERVWPEVDTVSINVFLSRQLR